jgi:hypothetical protein
MIPHSAQIDWSDVKVGARMHKHPYSVLSDSKALGVEVIYTRDRGALGQYHHGNTMETPCVTIECGQKGDERLHTFWHEIGHVLDFSDIDDEGRRMEVDQCKHSYVLEPMLDYYKDIINLDWRKVRYFNDFNPPEPLSYDWYAAGGDDPVELFARVVPTVVLWPRFCREKMPDLHGEIMRILREEFSQTKIPRATLNRFYHRMWSSSRFDPETKR